MGVVGQLVLQGSTQVLVQLQQGPQQAPLQRCGEGGSAAGSGHGPAVGTGPRSSAVASCQPIPVLGQCLPALFPPCPGWHLPLPSQESPGMATLNRLGRGSAWRDPAVAWGRGGLERLRVT